MDPLEDDNELARYLASYLEDNQSKFLVYKPQEDCDFVDGDKLERCIKEFYNSLL